jgi:transcriptional regulator with XRE-family HTH domain
MTFAQTVAKLMRECNLSPKDLTERSGVNAPYISRLLNGKIKEPTWEKACAIVDAFGLTVDEFRQIQNAE